MLKTLLLSHDLNYKFFYKEEVMDKEQNTNEEISAAHLLTKLRNEVFEGSDSQLALALGRPLEEIENWQRETEEIDEDGEMKIRNLANERLG